MNINPKETSYFLDMEEEYAQEATSRYTLIPVAYDGTSTFVKGADRGPEAIIAASDSLELYDAVYQCEACSAGIYTDQPAFDFSTPDTMVEGVYERVKHYLARNKRIGLMGGEHSVSIGAIRAMSEQFADLTVLQIDAHADLREAYHGSRYNHACVMRRAQEVANVVQVGIRSVCAEEKAFIVENNIFYAHQIAGQDNGWQERVCQRLSQHVYLSIDLDGFDPACLPATGTPLPGGLSWYEVNGLLEKVFQQCNVVGFDVVELCPQPDSKVSDVLAASLIYRIITMWEHFGAGK